jgi:hypothetical protein
LRGSLDRVSGEQGENRAQAQGASSRCPDPQVFESHFSPPVMFYGQSTKHGGKTGLPRLYFDNRVA